MCLTDSGLKSRRRERERRQEVGEKITAGEAVETEVRGQTGAEGRCYRGKPPAHQTFIGGFPPNQNVCIMLL